MTPLFATGMGNFFAPPMMMNPVLSMPRPAGMMGMTPVAAVFAIYPAVSMADVYQAAYAKAVADQQIDRLFNPEYYGDYVI